MSGKRHHHVWQMLQRGFGTRVHGDHHIWVYEKGVEPRQTVTRKFGRENFFYGPEGSVADTNITDFENSIQEIIHHARNAENGSELDRDVVAPMIAHLEMRSSFLRSEISHIGERTIKIFEGYLSSEKHATMLLSACIKNNPDMFEKIYDDLGISGDARQFADLVITQSLPNIVKEGSSEIAKLSKLIFPPLLGGMAETAKNAHIKSLETSFSQIGRTEKHLARNYFVHRTRTSKLILPDTTLAFLTKNGCTPISQEGDEIEQVILPVSNEVAIIGRNKSTTVRDDITLNRILSSCAFDAFIARDDLDEFARFAKRIGRNAHIIKDAEIKKMFSFSQLLD